MDQPGPPAPAREGNGLRMGGGQVGGHVWALFQAWSTLEGFPGEPGRSCRHRAPGVQAANPHHLPRLVAVSWLATRAKTRVEACWCHI